jgi:hypothetical protein
MFYIVLLDLGAAFDDEDDGHAVIMNTIQLFAVTTAPLFAALPGLGLSLDDDTDDEGANQQETL